MGVSFDYYNGLIVHVLPWLILRTSIVALFFTCDFFVKVVVLENNFASIDKFLTKQEQFCYLLCDLKILLFAWRHFSDMQWSGSFLVEEWDEDANLQHTFELVVET